jgi:hypothetical protein
MRALATEKPTTSHQALQTTAWLLLLVLSAGVMEQRVVAKMIRREYKIGARHHRRPKVTTQV